MKYRLNYNWNGYEKGDEFSTYDDGSLKPPKGVLTPWPIIVPETLELLLMSGALTPIEEECVKNGLCAVECPNCETIVKVSDDWNKKAKKLCNLEDETALEVDGSNFTFNKRPTTVNVLPRLTPMEKVELPEEITDIHWTQGMLLLSHNQLIRYLKFHEK